MIKLIFAILGALLSLVGLAVLGFIVTQMVLNIRHMYDDIW